MKKERVMEELDERRKRKKGRANFFSRHMF